MSPFLNVLGYLPTEQPYNAAPWNYNGTESVTEIPNFNVVDWVLVEILQVQITGYDTSFILIQRKAALIMKNGTITDLNGLDMLQFTGLSLTELYVRILHRNHLPVTSAIALTPTGGIFNYDFTTGAAQALGGALSQNEVASGKWGMIAGNGDGNWQDNNLDKDDVWLEQKELTGYYSGDYNMDSQVDTDDKVVKWQANSGKGSDTHPMLTPLNLPPAVPSDPQPANGAINQPLNTILGWTCSDPENDPLTYDIHFISQGQTATTYDPAEPLEYNTQYFWKIVAHDNYGNTTEGPLWTFTTEPVPPFQCGNPFTDVRDDQIYTTVQIGTQCWMAENLNIGTMITGTTEMTNNSIIEKYCYNNSTANCDVYGGLYQWNEMMQYSTTPGLQGICPANWHLPTDAEWCTLTQFIDPTVNCNTTNWSGTDVGIKMKSTTGWNSGGNGTNTSSFTALPGGFRISDSNFSSLGDAALFLSSTEFSSNSAWLWEFYYSNAFIIRYYSPKTYGFSVRCLQD
jgi:uncharacterized protein (TIGR02145 family)